MAALPVMRVTRLERSEEHTSELQSPCNLVCRLLLEKKKNCVFENILNENNKIIMYIINNMLFFIVYLHFSKLFLILESGVNRTSIGFIFFFNDTATTEIYTLSLHDALPIYVIQHHALHRHGRHAARCAGDVLHRSEEHTSELQSPCNLVCRLLLEKKKKIIEPTGIAEHINSSTND